MWLASGGGRGGGGGVNVWTSRRDESVKVGLNLSEPGGASVEVGGKTSQSGSHDDHFNYNGTAYGTIVYETCPHPQVSYDLID